MKSEDYVVLRASRLDLGTPFGGVLSTETPALDEEHRLDVEHLDKGDVARLSRDRNVKGMAPTMPMRLVEPTDFEDVAGPSEADATWGIKRCGVLDSPFTGEGVTVAVLDTGIDASHEAFTGVNVVEKDFTGEGNGDGNGHGTHVAGTVFGQQVDGFRFGVAPGVTKALIGKVLDSGGRGSTDQIARAIQWAVDSGAHIISMSLGMDFPGYAKRLQQSGLPEELATSRALEGYRANVRLFDAIAAMTRASGEFQQQTVILAAAGNESKRGIDPDFELGVAPPAAADGIVAVGALGKTGGDTDPLDVADFSNTGPNLSAPGVEVYSAKAGGGYRVLSGTSMATPHVAGLAALWAQKMLNETGRIKASELLAKVVGRAQTTPLVSGFDAMDIGAGLVQAPVG